MSVPNGGNLAVGERMDSFDGTCERCETTRIAEEFTRAFDLESEMFAPVTQALRPLLGFTDSCRVFLHREPTVGEIVPDLVLARVTGNVSFPRRPLTGVEAHVLALIEREIVIAESDLRGTLHLSEAGASRAVGRLEKQGFICRFPNGLLELKRTCFGDGVEIVAIELKLRRWRQALVQAGKYKRFANRVYVILDGNQTELPSSAIDDFRCNSIGLILQWRFWLDELVPAPRLSSITPDRIRVIQKVCQPSYVIT
jgi:hypothetical protein